MRAAVGIDVGGTKTAGAVVTADGGTRDDVRVVETRSPGYLGQHIMNHGLHQLRALVRTEPRGKPLLGSLKPLDRNERANLHDQKNP